MIGNCDSHGKNYSLLYKNNRVELSPLYDVVSTIIYSGLTDKLSMKIGKHYEIKKVTQEDFFLLAESLNIKYSVLSTIFNDFAKKYINVFEELKNDEKISRDVLNSIFQVVKSRF
ncbi:MAG: HipA domain-containing protein [Treponema sp.]|nr:HipA domain-containing protein [Treponema sp.]